MNTQSHPYDEKRRRNLKFHVDSSINDEADSNFNNGKAVQGTNKAASVVSKKAKNILLIVGSNKDIACSFRGVLEDEYLIIEALNSEEGYNKAIEIIPDLLICDMADGLEICFKLKSNDMTGHVPIIMLTPAATVSQQIEALKAGADDYLQKPVYLDLLKVKVHNLIDVRNKLIRKFSRQLSIEAKDVPIRDQDAEFIKRAAVIVEDNISDNSFDVDKFSRLMGVSRSQLLRKLKGLINDTPQALIRSARLNYASKLLKESKFTITEICYKTGFNYPAHFTQQFQSRFGLLPKEYRKKHQH